MANAFSAHDRMTAEAFMAWIEAQPDRPRYELLDGRIYEMSAERLIHAELKARIVSEFRRQIAERKLRCQALGDGMAVQVDEETIFEPDASVRCGPRLPGNATILTDPLVVVEVASPSTQRLDALIKLSRYFRNESIVHYLIVLSTKQTVLHHMRASDGRIVAKAYDDGIIVLDPPGLELSLAELFADDSLAPG
jgi:Uma2 family endonuclease